MVRVANVVHGSVLADDSVIDVLVLTDLLMLTAARPGYGRRANLVVPSRSVGAKPNLRHPAKIIQRFKYN